MPLSTYLQQTTKQRVRILTVDPTSRRIEAMLKDYGLIQIALWEIPAQFRWPKEGEIWTVYRENNFWMLGNPQESEDDPLPVEDLQPGDTKIGSEEATTYVMSDLAVRGNVGFYGGDPVAKPVLTYSRATETVAEQQLRQALATLGLVTDNTTA